MLLFFSDSWIRLPCGISDESVLEPMPTPPVLEAG